VVIVFDHVVHVCDLPQFDLCWLLMASNRQM